MARIYARRKGKSGSTHPIKRENPDWMETDPKAIEEKIVELARQGKSSSEIGTIMRDQSAIPDVRIATGKKLMQILKENELEPSIPEDLKNLLNKAKNLKEHLSNNPKDIHNKRNLQLVESKIRRLAKYYKREKKIPEKWKYKG